MLGIMADFKKRFIGIQEAFDKKFPSFEHNQNQTSLQTANGNLIDLINALSKPEFAEYKEVQTLLLQVKEYQLAPKSQDQKLVIETDSPLKQGGPNGCYYVDDKHCYEKNDNQFSYQVPAIPEIEKMLTHAYQTYGLPGSKAKVTLLDPEELVKQAYIYYKARGVGVVLKQHTALAADPQVQATIEQKKIEFTQKAPTEIGTHESQRHLSVPK